MALSQYFCLFHEIDMKVLLRIRRCATTAAAAAGITVIPEAALLSRIRVKKNISLVKRNFPSKKPNKIIAKIIKIFFFKYYLQTQKPSTK